MTFLNQIPRQQKEQWFGILAGVFYFVFKLVYAGSNDIARDEPFSIYTAQMSLSEIIAYLRGGNNPPLYEMFLHFWIKLAGTEAFGVRLPSVFFGSVSAILIYNTGRRLFGFEAGVTALMLFTFSVLHTAKAHEARVYTLFIMLGLLAFNLLIRYIMSGRKQWLFLLVPVNILLIYAHYFGFFILLNQLMALLFFSSVRKDLKYLLAAGAVVILSYLPQWGAFFAQFHVSVERGTWVSPPLPQHYYGFINLFLNNKFVTLTFLVLVVLMLFAMRSRTLRSGRNEIGFSSRMLVFTLLWFLLPYTLMFAASFKAPMFIERYVLFTSIFLYLFAGGLLAYLRVNRTVKVIAIILFTVVLALSTDPAPSNNRHIRQAVAFVKERQTPETIVLVCPAYAYYTFSYHYDKDAFTDYRNTITRLEAQNVFLISSVPDLYKVLAARRISGVIYFESASSLVDPEAEIPQRLLNYYTLREKRNFFEIYSVSLFSEKFL